MNSNFLKLTIYAIILLFVVVILSGIVFVATAPPETFEDDSWEYRDTGKKYDWRGHAVACTEEARICPDGSSVGRVPPSCEFAACPSMQNEQPVAQDPTGVACTMDARMCPDGSFVGRVPPSCEFAACAPASPVRQ